MTNEEQIKKIDELIELILRMIPKEREAQRIYSETAGKAPSEMTRLLFARLAEQEGVHERKLKAALELLEAEKEELSELRTEGAQGR